MNALHKPITILGGMGPQASSQLYDHLIAKSQQHPKHQDGLFPHIILRSLAIEDFISNPAKLEPSRRILVDAAQSAAVDNPCAVAIACNTAHLLAHDVAAHCEAPFISLIELTSDTVSHAGLSRVGLLASPMTIRTKLYERALQKRGIECVTPNTAQEKRIEGVIRSVISGVAGREEAKALAIIADDLLGRGAQGIILGCTELPLIFPKDYRKTHIFDTLDLLSRKLIETYYTTNLT